jgi:hypothetical protein
MNSDLSFHREGLSGLKPIAEPNRPASEDLAAVNCHPAEREGNDGFVLAGIEDATRTPCAIDRREDRKG